MAALPTKQTMSVIVFDDSTDYQKAEEEVKSIYSERISKLCGCSCHHDAVLNDVLLYLNAAQIDKTTNIARYKSDIEAAYKLLTANSFYR